MQANYFEIEQGLEIAITSGQEIEVISTGRGMEVERTLRSALEQVCTRYDQPELADHLFSCLVELATNGTRANMKHLFFEERGWDADPSLYPERIAAFKKESMEAPWIQSYGQKARERGLMVRILVRHDPNGIHMRVVNNKPLADPDKVRVHEKIAQALQYKDLVQYSIHHADDSEGQGLGLALAVFTLRSNQIDPRHLWLESDGQETTAHLEVPLSPNFQSKRRG